MPLEISFRTLNNSDTPEVFSILRNVAGPGLPHWSQEQIATEMSPGLGAFDLSGQLLGFVLYKKNFDHIDITFLASHPRVQKQGVMTRLFEYLRTIEGNLPWWLEVHEDNLTARKFYENQAFKSVGSRMRYYRDNGTAILYSRDI